MITKERDLFLETQELRREKAAMELEIKELRKEKVKLAAELDEEKARAKQFKTAWEYQGDRVIKLEGALEAANNKVEALKMAAPNYGKEAEDLRRRNEILAGKVHLWKTTARRRADGIKELEEKLGLQTKYSHTKDAEIRELGKDVADLEAKVDFWKKAVAGRALVIVGLEQKIKDMKFKYGEPGAAKAQAPTLSDLRGQLEEVLSILEKEGASGLIDSADHSAEMARLEDRLQESEDEIKSLWGTLREISRMAIASLREHGKGI